MPWTRFGIGSHVLGGWDPLPGWSLLASAAAVVGLLAWGLLGPRRRAASGAASAAFGLVIAVAAGYAWAHPPAFTKPWLGPVVALVAGLAALVAGALETWRVRAVG